MALTILTNPTDGDSINNEMLFIIQESTKADDPVNYPNYKYVLDVYVNSELKARLKAVPDPVNFLGVFNVANILRSFASYQLKANYSNPTETNQAYLAYKVNLGEEYSDTLYTNLVTDSSDRYAFKSYAVRPFESTDVLGDALFASNQPSTIYSWKSAKWLLLNYYEDAYPGGTEDIDFNIFDSGGNSLATGRYSGRTVTAKNFLQINAGFQKLIAQFSLSASVQSNASYYTVTINGVTKTVRFICDKFTPITLAWLNQYGAYESYQFGYVSKKSFSVTGKTFQRLPYEINASGDVSYAAEGVFYGGKRKYASQAITEMKLTSHLLNSDEYTWLADLFSSSDVFMYSSTLDKFFPVTIKETNYEYRDYFNSRLTPLEFSVEFADNFNGQYL